MMKLFVEVINLYLTTRSGGLISNCRIKSQAAARREMYVTRNASVYKNFPEAKSESPPGGPGSGILVIQDEAFEAEMTTCFGACRDPFLYHLPFPQNQLLTVRYKIGRSTLLDYVYFMPVLGKSPSLNQYYVVIGKGKHTGEASTCSKEEDMTTSCFSKHVKDVEPTVFVPDNSNIYQQIEVIPKSRKGYFTAKSVTSDGFPQSFLRRNGWRVSTTPKPNCQIGEALGITRSSKERPVDTKHSSSSPVVVGKWYCPFIFVKEEGVEVKEQLDRNVWYEMTLEQYWEEIYASDVGTNTIEANVYVQNPRTLLYGEEEAEGMTTPVVDGVRWFRPTSKSEVCKLGLSTVVVERMRWEQERRGWVESDLVRGRVEKSGYSWNMFRFFVLVERFVLKRMDGSVVFTCEFKYTNEVRSTCE